MRPILFVPLFVAAALVPALPAPAHACGGCFAPPQTVQLVTDHRMAMAVHANESILWDQIRYTGAPEDFAWILPVWGTVEVQVASPTFFDQLEQVTNVRVQAPPVMTCASPSGGGGGCGSGASFAPSASGRSADQETPVTVVQQQTVGPYESVVLRSEDAMALTAWLEGNGFSIPDGIRPVIEFYTQRRMDFLALRLRPGVGVQAMQPVRVRYQTANMVLPLRMVAAGVGDKVGITLWVFGEGRYEPANFGLAYVRESDLVWDWDNRRSNYPQAFSAAINRLGGRAWVAEYAQSSTAGSQTRTMESQTDWNLATQGYRASVWITRLRTDLNTAFLDGDLQLQASSESVAVSNTLQARQSTGTPPGQRCSSITTIPTPGDFARRPALTLASVAASILALIAGRKRARH